MAKTFFFYDLETSGLNPRSDRIMQFAGQRTDMDFRPIGEPINELVAINDDTIPSPEALMVTGITPQKTIEEGWTEAEFSKKIVNEWFTPDTIIVGFNSVRFDDEFIRHLLWRNFHDPYEWSWSDGRSRWDLLDVVRMTRALRPEGIQWPVNELGDAVNKLEPITLANGIDHDHAHDALSDVLALIDVARLLKSAQPQLFDYLLTMRDKKAVQNLVNLEDKRPFVYTSGRYDKQFEKTTVAIALSAAPNSNVLVYDLRHDPSPFVGLSEQELSDRLFASWDERQSEGFLAVPVKPLQYNRCPAVAPLGVLQQGDGWSKIGLTSAVVEKNLKELLAHPDFAERVRSAFESRPRPAGVELDDPAAQLYDGFLSNGDRVRVEAVRNATAQQLVDMHPEFSDSRLDGLLLHYKARSFPATLSDSEMVEWEKWRSERLLRQVPLAVKSIENLLHQSLSDHQMYVLSELKLWIESVVPSAD